jgi:hypothetical protein
LLLSIAFVLGVSIVITSVILIFPTLTPKPEPRDWNRDPYVHLFHPLPPTPKMNIEELNAFLTNVHNTLILNRKLSTAHFTVVMGNEAADLDSMVCAVLYAYLLQKQQQLHPVDSQIDKHYYIPIINIPQDDFPIHTESVYIFNRVGLDTSKLVFWDTARLQALIEKDVDSPRSPRIELQSVILVDHNIPTGSQQFLSPFIKEVCYWKTKYSSFLASE